ncbi:MAG: MerR family transcriptional regulator [Lachnospiraceae bacterium]|nr:MerR family transcriptional regulator [Lachnospiraceae bacterium]
MYTVKEVAELLGVSVHTVRYYDDRGLIPGTKRNSTNQRLFDDMGVEWLFVSRTLMKTGLSLKDVKHYIELYQQGDSTLTERYELMQKQKEKTLQKMEELKLRLAVLDRKIDHYGKLLEGEEDSWSHEYMQKLIREGADHE